VKRKYEEKTQQSPINKGKKLGLGYDAGV